MSIITSAARVWLTRSFRPFEFTSNYQSTLNYQSAKNLGLYVHIPFCRSLCDFCPYCKTVYDPDLAERYVEALLKEIELVGSTAEQKTTVTSLYFGGGTPALVSEHIKRIVDRLNQFFTITDGIGLELHPYDVTEEKLTTLKAAGVTRVSIGVQSFQPEYLALLGRDHFDYSAMFEALAKVSFETVSMDFIFALPEQTLDLLKRDIEHAFANGANHIAVYPFIDFSFTNRNFTKMDNKRKKQLLYELVAYCEEHGYQRDSIWTFSKLGDSKYSSMTRENFLGFGCSATTLLPDSFKINTFDVPSYIQRITEGSLPTSLTIEFTPRQRMIYYLFWTAYSMQVDSSDFEQFFGQNLHDYYGFELWFAKVTGMLREQNGVYEMTTRGSYYYHYFEHFYTLSYIDQMWNLMKDTPFPTQLAIR